MIRNNSSIMRELLDLYEKLERYSDFDKDPENCEKFLDIAGEIVSIGDTSSISELLKYFDDNSDYDWVLESLRCSIENFSDDLYVKQILSNLVLLLNNPYWCTTIIYAIFNNENCLKIFCQNMHLAGKKSLLKLFDIMEKESPHHQELIRQLRSEL